VRPIHKELIQSFAMSERESHAAASEQQVIRIWHMLGKSKPSPPPPPRSCKHVKSLLFIHRWGAAAAFPGAPFAQAGSHPAFPALPPTLHPRVDSGLPGHAPAASSPWQQQQIAAVPQLQGHAFTGSSFLGAGMQHHNGAPEAQGGGRPAPRRRRSFQEHLDSATERHPG